MLGWPIALTRVARTTSWNDVFRSVAAAFAHGYDVILSQLRSPHPAVGTPVAVGRFDSLPLLVGESTGGRRLTVSSNLSRSDAFGRHLLGIVCIPSFPSCVGLIPVTKAIFTLFGGKVVLMGQIVLAFPLLAIWTFLPLLFCIDGTGNLHLPSLSFMGGVFRSVRPPIFPAVAITADTFAVMLCQLATRRTDDRGFSMSHLGVIIP
jgi:hypothetical protein